MLLCLSVSFFFLCRWPFSLSEAFRVFIFGVLKFHRDVSRRGLFKFSPFSMETLALHLGKLIYIISFSPISLFSLSGTPIGHMLDFLHWTSMVLIFFSQILGNSYQAKETVVSWSVAHIELDDSLNIPSSSPSSPTETGQLKCTFPRTPCG